MATFKGDICLARTETLFDWGVAVWLSEMGPMQVSLQGDTTTSF